MRRLLLLPLVFCSVVTVFGQLDAATENKLKDRKTGNEKKDSTWVTGGVINVNFTQVYLSNWAGGGQNAISTQGLVSLFANYASNKASLDNSLDLAYGIIKQGRRDTPWFKNDDRIELNSKYGYLAKKDWYYSGLLNFRTQFTYGYNTVSDTIHISSFMAPAYNILALGMDYKPKDGNLTVFISPITSKLTFVMDDYLSGLGAFGVNAGQTVRSEFGGYLKAGYVKEKPFNMEGVTFKTNVTLFSNYLENPENLDVTWETLTNIKLNKYLSMSLSTYLIYDDDIDIARYDDKGAPIYMKDASGVEYLDGDGKMIQAKGPATQFKEAWAVGFAFKF